MSTEAAIRARLEAELGRIFGEMIAAQEAVLERDRIIADLRVQLAASQDELQKGDDP